MGTAELHLPGHLHVAHLLVNRCQCRPCGLNLRIVSDDFEEQVDRFVVILGDVCEVGSSKQQLNLMTGLVGAMVLVSAKALSVH